MVDLLDITKGMKKVEKTDVQKEKMLVVMTVDLTEYKMVVY